MNALRDAPATALPPVKPVVAPTNLISLQEACLLLPSPRPGKRTNVATLRRLVFSGRLPAIRCGQYWYVEPDDVKALLVPTMPTQIRPVPKLSDEVAARLIKKGIYTVTPEERERLVKKGLLPKPQASPVGARRARR
jgi:hypothetical protein